MEKYIGKKLDGRYEITELIGVGGMAEVYKGVDVIDNKPVAIKVLKKEFAENEEFLRRFRNESKAIAVLSHPNIVKILLCLFRIVDRVRVILSSHAEQRNKHKNKNKRTKIPEKFTKRQFVFAFCNHISKEEGNRKRKSHKEIFIAEERAEKNFCNTNPKRQVISFISYGVQRKHKACGNNQSRCFTAQNISVMIKRKYNVYDESKHKCFVFSELITQNVRNCSKSGARK